ncbi:potassium channel family protein [Arcanobacterium wilhelmae]|uniref:potassium channel family protein n=1 Tax=Arcanobacterium wilhelmae TaxID=1803177 RepID=UPI0031011BC8
MIRLALSKRKLHWFIHHLVDLAIVALPLLRPLRLLQLINLVKILGKSASATFRGKLALYSSASVFLLVLVGSLAVLDAERGEPNTLIHDFPDALWWAVCTITTVGYGDLYPISWTGRAIAVCMMVAGVALIGVVTASIASWIVETIETNSDAREATLEDEITALRAEINALRQQLSPATNPNSMSENHASNG